MHIMADRRSRREFLSGMIAGAGLLAVGEAGLTAVRWSLGAASGAEPPPETPSIRVARDKAIAGSIGVCTAPLYVLDRFLRAEGFTDVKYVEYEGAAGPGQRYLGMAAGEADVSQGFSGSLIVRLDKGDPLIILGGSHVGCFVLVGSDRIRTIGDLKNSTVAVAGLGSTEHVFLSSIVAYVGLNPARDINWVIYKRTESMRLLRQGRIDAMILWPPLSNEIRARKVGRVLLNSMMDRPWSQYFCCVPFANRGFVSRYPVATKRWLRAYLQAADFCVREPEQVARLLVKRQYTDNYTFALQTLRESVNYGSALDYDPEDTVRFYTLRLQEAGMIKSTPQKIIAEGTDWRFLNQIKRESKRSQQPLAMASDPHADHRVR